MPLDHATQRGVKARLVEGMSHLADQTAHGFACQLRVRIKRYYEAYIGRAARGDAVACNETGIDRAAQQPIQLMQFAALAFPADPACLAGIPQAAPVQEQEPWAAGCGAIVCVEAVDPVDGRL